MNVKRIDITNFLKHELVKDTIWTTFFSIIGRSASFLIPFFIAAWFGISSETDAFFFAYGLILLLSGIFAPIVESVIVPFIVEIRAKDEAEVKIFLGTILGFSSLLLLGVGGIFLVVLKPLLRLVTKFPANSIDLIFWLLLETIPLLVIIGGTSFFSGALNAYKKFHLPAVSPLARGVVTILFIYMLKDKMGVHAIAIGYLLGELCRLFLLLFEVIKQDIFSFHHLSWRWDAKPVEFLKTSSYQVIGMVVISLNPMVDKTMATWLGEGSVSILEYANRLYQAPVTMLTTGLMVTALSHWSSQYYGSDNHQLDRSVTKTAKLVALISAPCVIILILLQKPLIHFAYARGAFDATKLEEVGLTWGFYMLGFIPYIVSQIFVRRYLVLKKTNVLFWLAVSCNIINVVANFILIYFWGVKGIALSTTVVYTSACIILYKLFADSKRLDSMPKGAN